MLLNISRKPKYLRDSRLSNWLSKNLLINKLLNSWRLEIKKKKFWTNKLLRPKIKPLHFLSKKKSDDRKWNKPLRRAERIKLLELKKKLNLRNKRRLNFQNSGNSETMNSLLLSSKREKRKDKEELNWQTILKNKLLKRMPKTKMPLLWINIWHWKTNLYRINKKRTSTHMLRSVSLNGSPKARTLNHWSWSSRTTRRELCEQT